MTERNDYDPGDQFRALRREDAAAAPSFRATLAAARACRDAPPRRRALRLAAAAVVIASIAVALLLRRHGVPTDFATVRFRTPTDFLLALPNEQLLRTVPALGRVTITLDRRTP